MRSSTSYITYLECPECGKVFRTTEGSFCSPEGAAAMAGIFNMVKNGIIDPDAKTVFFNTASSVKYL